MHNNLIKVFQIYSFIILFMVGVGINAYFFSGESFSPFIDNANAKIE